MIRLLLLDFHTVRRCEKLKVQLIVYYIMIILWYNANTENCHLNPILSKGGGGY